LPDGYQKTGCESYLSRIEIRRMAQAFAGLGVWKIRVTGGEPTIRPDFLDIVKDISELEGVRRLAFTTNGYKLSERAEDYYAAGLRAKFVHGTTIVFKKLLHRGSFVGSFNEFFDQQHNLKTTRLY
jgi:molybdenum cofactor biosynthesis enzyme MoaA